MGFCPSGYLSYTRKDVSIIQTQTRTREILNALFRWKTADWYDKFTGVIHH